MLHTKGLAPEPGESEEEDFLISMLLSKNLSGGPI